MSVNFRDEILKDMAISSSSDNVHDKYKNASMEERRAASNDDRLPFAVAMINVLGDLNTSSIIRSAHIFGAKEILVFGRNKIDSRATVGAEHYSTIRRFGGQDKENLDIDPDIFVNGLKESNYYPIFIEQGGIPVTLLTKNSVERLFVDKLPCFVFGNETRGIPNNILETTNRFNHSKMLSICQRGVIRSLNVGVAAGIILHHVSYMMRWDVY